MTRTGTAFSPGSGKCALKSSELGNNNGNLCSGQLVVSADRLIIILITAKWCGGGGDHVYSCNM